MVLQLFHPPAPRPFVSLVPPPSLFPLHPTKNPTSCLFQSHTLPLSPRSTDPSAAKRNSSPWKLSPKRRPPFGARRANGMLHLTDFCFPDGGMGLRSPPVGASPPSPPPAPRRHAYIEVRSSPAEEEYGDSEDDGDGDFDDPFPDGWEEYTYLDIRDHFDCGYRSGDNHKSLPRLEDWELMRKTFTEVVDGEKKWDDPVPPTLGYSLEKGVPVPPPYFPKASSGTGRGLFASRFIRKGELVHDGSHSDVVFPDALAWRRFVFALGGDLACDCTDWHWMQRLEEGGEYFMVGGLNISSLMNSGGEEYGNKGGTPNALPESAYSGRFYATRDIERFEEILTDYDSYYTNWEEVGL